MNGIVLAVIGLASAIGGGGIWAYMSTRRTTAGQVDTSDASTVFDAMQLYQTRMDADMKDMRAAMTKLDADYALERRERIQCQSDIAILKSQNSSAAIIEAARKEAASIRFDAAKAAEVLKAAADKAAAGLVAEAATAKQVVDDARDS